MKYKRLGHTGIFVSEIALGTMTFSGEGFYGGVIGTLGQKEATPLVEKSIAAGVNFIDTADVYSFGQSEIMTGQAIKDLGLKRNEIVLATKVFGQMGGGVNDIGLSRAHIRDAVARSLERLQTDYIDLYQVHHTDHITPVEETMRALDDLVREGLVHYIGASNWAAWKLMKANGIAAINHAARFETVQAYYSLAGRDLERELVPLMEEEKIGCLVWSPLAGGYLSGKFGPGADSEAEGRRKTFDFPPIDKARADRVITALRPIAKAHGTSVARVALAWVLAKPFVTSVIVGVRTLAQLEDNLEAVKLTLTAEETATLDKLSELPVEYPGWMIARRKEERMPQPK
jgi:aryl-alcohol dehydrogenase-like predicted oxidoreductase